MIHGLRQQSVTVRRPNCLLDEKQVEAEGMQTKRCLMHVTVQLQPDAMSAVWMPGPRP